MRFEFEGTLEELASIIKGHLYTPEVDRVLPAVPPKDKPVAVAPATRPVAPSTKDRAHGRQHLFNVLDYYRSQKIDFLQSKIVKDFTQYASNTTVMKWLEEWMSDPAHAVSYNRVLTTRQGSKPRMVAYNHTGVIRLPAEPNDLKAIPPKGAPAKQKVAPKFEVEEEEGVLIDEG